MCIMSEDVVSRENTDKFTGIKSCVFEQLKISCYPPISCITNEIYLWAGGVMVLCAYSSYTKYTTQIYQTTIHVSKSSLITNIIVIFVVCFKESDYSIVVCNTHFANLRLFQRSGTNLFYPY